MTRINCIGVLGIVSSKAHFRWARDNPNNVINAKSRQRPRYIVGDDLIGSAINSDIVPIQIEFSTRRRNRTMVFISSHI